MSRLPLMSLDNQQSHGRNAKGEATRRRIVESAAELFHAQGVDGTGLEQTNIFPPKMLSFARSPFGGSTASVRPWKIKTKD